MTAQARLLGGRYQVGELLGYGGMAEVHRGRDLRLGRDVAELIALLKPSEPGQTVRVAFAGFEPVTVRFND